MVTFEATAHGRARGVSLHTLGHLPDMLSVHDPRRAAEQFNDNYAHGGGWRPYHGFSMSPNGTLTAHGDPDLQPLAVSQFRDERIYFYDFSWVAIVQPGGGCQVARMD